MPYTSSTAATHLTPSKVVEKPGRSFHPLYMLLSALGQLLIMAATLAPLLSIRSHFQLGLFASFLLFFPLFWGVSLLAHWAVRRSARLRPGLYAHDKRRARRWAWEFMGFLTIMNLHFLLLTAFVPPLWRASLYRLLGARIGGGLVVIGGQVHDAFMVTIEERAMVGLNTILLPHALTSDNSLLLAPIRVGKGAVIGACAVLMPGVSIGAGAMVEAMSFVPAFTKIGPGETWGGHPAVLRKGSRHS